MLLCMNHFWMTSQYEETGYSYIAIHMINECLIIIELWVKTNQISRNAGRNHDEIK